MTNKDKCSLAYIAGLLDGEGCISIDKGYQAYRKDRTRKIMYRLSVRFGMSEPIGMAFLKHQFPRCHFYNMTNRKEIRKDGSLKKPEYKVSYFDNKAYDFLKEIKPYIINKREQLDVALSFQVRRRKTYAKYNGKNYPQSYWNQQEKCYLKMKELHRKVYKGVKTVEPLLQKLELRQYCAKRKDVEQIFNNVRNFFEGAETRLK